MSRETAVNGTDVRTDKLQKERKAYARTEQQQQ